MGIPFLRFMIRKDEPVTVEHVLDHVGYVAQLVGVEHVGVGSVMDLVGNPNPVNGPPMTDWDIQAILGTNVARVLGLIWPR